jgi:hypothetical protein
LFKPNDNDREAPDDPALTKHVSGHRSGAILQEREYFHRPSRTFGQKWLLKTLKLISVG